MVLGARRLTRVGIGGLVVMGAAIALLGCDTGGLLVAQGRNPDKPAGGHPGTELVSGGTRASNDKYKVVYVVGQPSPQQGVATAPDQRLNGGLVGAVADK